jgi:hypothetical protein
MPIGGACYGIQGGFRSAERREIFCSTVLEQGNMEILVNPGLSGMAVDKRTQRDIRQEG